MSDNPPIPPVPVLPKSRMTYVLLAIFFGGLGIHNFYAGYIGRGIAQLLISVLTLFMLSAISWFWAVIEACVVTKDTNGTPFAA